MFKHLSRNDTAKLILAEVYGGQINRDCSIKLPAVAHEPITSCHNEPRWVEREREREKKRRERGKARASFPPRFPPPSISRVNNPHIEVTPIHEQIGDGSEAVSLPFHQMKIRCLTSSIQPVITSVQRGRYIYVYTHLGPRVGRT